MSRPAAIVRHDELDLTATDAPATELAPGEAPMLSQAQIDAAHGTTGWSAYDVWRARVFVPQVPGYKKPGGKP